MLLALIRRNLKVYIRDREAVFFSILGILIVILLYIFFLGDAVRDEIKDLKESSYIVSTYIMSGVMCVSTLTTTLGAFSIKIEDHVNLRYRDFCVTPISRNLLATGYLLSSVIIGIAIGILCLIGAECYIVSQGGKWLPISSLTGCLFLLTMAVLCAASFSFFLVSMVHTTAAYSGLNVILGTLCVFLTGVYIPIGSLNDTLQMIVKTFPLSHSGVLFRKLLMQDAVSVCLSGATQEQVTDFSVKMGMEFYVSSYLITNREHFLILALSSLCFWILGLFCNGRKQ